MADNKNNKKAKEADNQNTKKSGNGLKLIILGVVAYLLGIFVITGGFRHDLLILGGAIIFIVGLISLVTNRKKSK